MINLIFWEDEDRKGSGRNSCCCAVDDTEASGFFLIPFIEKQHSKLQKVRC